MTRNTRTVAAVAVATTVFGAGQLAQPVAASDWRGTRSVISTVVVSDNVDTREDGEVGVIGIISPTFAATRSGAGANASIVYRANASAQVGGSGDFQLNHQLSAFGSTELVDERFTLDGQASISQQAIVNPAITRTSNSSGSDDDITDVYALSLTPRFRQRLGNFARFEASYTAGLVINTDADDSDSFTHGLRAGIDSGSRFDTVRWGADYSASFETGDNDTTLQRVSADVDVAVTRRLGLIGSVGYELNADDDVDDETEDDLDGANASLGVRWTPSRRTRLRAGIDYQPAGTAPFLELDHRGRRFGVNARIRQDVTTSSREQLEGDSLAEEQLRNASADADAPPPDPSPDPVVTILDPDTGAPPIRSELVVRRSASATLSYNAGRRNAALNLSYVDRDFQRSGDKETVSTVGVTVGTLLDRRTTVSADARLQLTRRDREVAGEELGDTDRISFGVQATRQFASNLNGTVAYRFTDTDSSGSDGFTENRITVSVGYTF